MNIFTILVVTMVLNTIAIPIFDLGVFPKWANQTNNATCVTSLSVFVMSVYLLCHHLFLCISVRVFIVHCGRFWIG